MTAASPREVYRRLLKFFGPQGWWPVTPENGQSPVYHPGVYFPADETARFEITLGAILTQNTAWKNVERALENIRRARITAPSALLKTSPGKLQQLIRPSGYFVQKEKKLRIFCRHLTDNRLKLDKWLGGNIKGLRAELLSLWGIGPETADSIMLYAGARPVFVVDAYTLRAGRRLGWFDKNADYYSAQKYLVENLPKNPRVYNEFHALIVALGKDYCKTKPRCGDCPLADLCGKEKYE